MENLKLFVVLLGGYNPGDMLESHNLFICAGNDLNQLTPKMKKFWPHATHVDGYMILGNVDGYEIELVKGKHQFDEYPKLVIGNIGYYKEGEFAEFHKLIPMVLNSAEDSISDKLKKDADFVSGQSLSERLRSHLDDKHTVAYFDVDDVISVQDSIEGYSLKLTPSEKQTENILKLGYTLTELRNL